MSRIPLLTQLATMLLVASAPGQFGSHYTGPPIRYGEGSTDDAVARLQRHAGEAAALPWRREGRRGYLRALLRALSVPESSQTLVFSKTSFQNDLITPANPRAVYFGDEAYVGYVPGGRFIEITAMDPEQGPVFYVLDQRSKRPTITRKTHECLTCHGGSRTANWPGHLVRSVYPTREGHPMTKVGSFVTTQDSPFEERWGGWYVTGEHGDMRHMGNVTAAGDRVPVELDREAGANRQAVPDRVDVTRYLGPHSDIVSLLVLEHQTGMQNLLTRASYRVRRALHLRAATNRALNRPADRPDEATRRVIRDAATQILEYLLFKHEVRLPSPVRGASAFAQEFPRSGPRDPKGRSLRDLDLRTRLFRYPCSYLIYSEAFDALPVAVRDRVYSGLWRVLEGRLSRRSWGLSRDQRQAILDILLATKQGLPASWKPIRVR